MTQAIDDPTFLAFQVQPEQVELLAEPGTLELLDANVVDHLRSTGKWTLPRDRCSLLLVEIDGTAFYRYQVMQSVLVPLKSGRIEIPAIEAAIGILV